MRSRRLEDEDRNQRERLSARVAELEQRVMLLEARLRRTVAEQKARRGKGPVRTARPRPRCPGCLLELPKGRRHDKDTCVWCGFVFAAVRPGIRPAIRPVTRAGATKAR